MTVAESIQYINLDKIVAENQPRKIFDAAALQGLAGSFNEVGQLQPIRVRKKGEKFVIVDGERRFRAAKLAGQTTVACIVETKDLLEGEILHKQIISECQRESLPPLEKARAIDHLMKAAGWTATETAKRLGLSGANVSKYLAILKLPEAIQDQIGQGRIPWSAAPELAAVENPEQQAALAQQLTEGRLTRDGLKTAKNGVPRRGTIPAEGRPSRITAVMGEGRSVTVFTVKSSLENFIEILEELLGKARRARAQGVEIGTFVQMLRDQAAGT